MVLHVLGPVKVNTDRGRAHWRCSCGAAGVVWLTAFCCPKHEAAALYRCALDEHDLHRLREAASIQDLLAWI